MTTLKRLITQTLKTCLILPFLTACDERVKEVIVLPPELLIQDTMKPERQGELLKDVFINEKNRGFAIDACNADKKLLREWRNNNSETSSQ